MREQPCRENPPTEQAGAIHDTTEIKCEDNYPPLFWRPYDVKQSGHGETGGLPFPFGPDRGAQDRRTA